VLSVRTCEDSNCILALRLVALASRNLPVLFYRVHCEGRGYGTGWEQRLAEQSRAPEPRSGLEKMDALSGAAR